MSVINRNQIRLSAGEIGIVKFALYNEASRQHERADKLEIESTKAFERGDRDKGERLEFSAEDARDSACDAERMYNRLQEALGCILETEG